MPKYQSLALPAAQDPFAQLQAAEAARQAQPEAGAWETFSRAFGVTSGATALADYWDINSHQDDPEWEPPSTIMDDIAEAGIPPEYGLELIESKSQAEYAARLRIYQSRHDDQMFLAQQGGKGFAAIIGASALDPVGLAVDAGATLAGGAGAANRLRKLWAVAGDIENAGRAQRVAQASLAAGVGSATLGQIQAGVDPTYDVKDLAVDFAAGSVFGLVFDGMGGLLNSQESFDLATGMQKTAKRAKFESEIDLANQRIAEAKAAAKLAYDNGDEIAWRSMSNVVDSNMEQIKKLRAKLDSVKFSRGEIRAKQGFGDSAGAARVPGSVVDGGVPSIWVDPTGNAGGGVDVRVPLAAEAQNNANIISLSNPMGGYGDIASVTRAVDDPEMRQMARLLTKDSVGVRRVLDDGTVVDEVNDIATEELATNAHNQTFGSFMREKEQVLRDKFKGVKGWATRLFSSEERIAVHREAGRIAKGIPGTGSQHAQQIAQSFHKMTSEIWDRMVRAGVKGVTGARKVVNYVPRIHRRALMDLLQGRFKGLPNDSINERLKELFVKGIQSYRIKAGLDFSPELSSKVAETMAGRILYKKANPQTFELSEMDSDFLDEILDQAQGLTPAEREAIYLHFTNKDPVRGPDAKPIDFLKERLGLDESVSITLDDGSQLFLSDLYEDDLEFIGDVYAKRAAGITAFAERGFSNHADFINAARAMASRYNTSHGAGKGDVWLHNIEMAYKHILGQPLHNDPTGRLTRAARNLTGISFVQKAWQLGWSMMAENGAIMGVAGHRAMLQTIPAYKEIFDQVRTGTLTTERAKELAALANLGTSQLRNSVSRRYFEDMGGFAGGKGLGKFENALSAWEKLVTTVSGLGPLQDFQQLTLGYAWTQRLFNFANGSETLTPALRERLLDYGLRQSDMDQLFEHLRTKARSTNGVLDSMDIDSLPPALRRRFEAHLHRATTHAVQLAEIGSTATWQHNPVARIVTQFRAFSLTAFNRRTMHSWVRKDATAGLMLTYGAMWGALALVGRTYVNYPEGHPMREKIKDPVWMMKTVFATTGESSIIPMFWDTLVGRIAGEDFMIGNGHRSTNSAGDAFEGIPTVNLGSNLFRMLSLPRNVATDNWTDKDVTAALSLVPWQTMVGWQRFVRETAAKAPKKELNINAVVENNQQ